MKILILIALIGLCSSNPVDPTEYRGIFPLRAVATIFGETKDQVKFGGRVEFEQQEFAGNVTVKVQLSGLPKHDVEGGLPLGLALQTYGVRTLSRDIKTACSSSGPVFNPTRDPALSTPFATVTVQKDGSVNQVVETSRVELFGPYSGLGRTVTLQGVDGCGIIGMDTSSSGAAENGFFTAVVDPTPVGPVVPKTFDVSSVLSLVPPDFWQKNGLDIVRQLFPNEDLANMEPRAYAFLNADLPTVFQRASQRPDLSEWFTYLMTTIAQQQQSGIVPTLNTLLTPTAYETLRRRLFKTQ